MPLFHWNDCQINANYGTGSLIAHGRTVNEARDAIRRTAKTAEYGFGRIKDLADTISQHETALADPSTSISYRQWIESELPDERQELADALAKLEVDLAKDPLVIPYGEAIGINGSE
ncbi:hypothetical protein [Pleomorphomonas sp. PLEO]|uniref:hypothetical protein n=1 Tax=Pleomorphomonas sp. PLEO TaxID=3239306 RepID=UPI00351E104C